MIKMMKKIMLLSLVLMNKFMMNNMMKMKMKMMKNKMMMMMMMNKPTWTAWRERERPGPVAVNWLPSPFGVRVIRPTVLRAPKSRVYKWTVSGLVQRIALVPNPFPFKDIALPISPLLLHSRSLIMLHGPRSLIMLHGPRSLIMLHGLRSLIMLHGPRSLICEERNAGVVQVGETQEEEHQKNEDSGDADLLHGLHPFSTGSIGREEEGKPLSLSLWCKTVKDIPRTTARGQGERETTFITHLSLSLSLSLSLTTINLLMAVILSAQPRTTGLRVIARESHVRCSKTYVW